MNNKSKIFFWILTLIVITVLIILLWSRGGGSKQTASALDSFAQCLAEKKITMYGADWCPHCQNEKKAFGASFKYVPYVECPENIKRCLDLGIEGYPTWIFPDGRKLIGEQGIEKLRQESGCPIE